MSKQHPLTNFIQDGQPSRNLAYSLNKSKLVKVRTNYLVKGEPDSEERHEQEQFKLNNSRITELINNSKKKVIFSVTSRIEAEPEDRNYSSNINSKASSLKSFLNQKTILPQKPHRYQDNDKYLSSNSFRTLSEDKLSLNNDLKELKSERGTVNKDFSKTLQSFNIIPSSKLSSEEFGVFKRKKSLSSISHVNDLKSVGKLLFYFSFTKKKNKEKMWNLKKFTSLLEKVRLMEKKILIKIMIS